MLLSGLSLYAAEDEDPTNIERPKLPLGRPGPAANTGKDYSSTL
jgi:hypothetical protein